MDFFDQKSLREWSKSQNTRNYHFCCMIFALFLSFPLPKYVNSAELTVLKEAETLLEQENPQSAYRLLENHKEEYVGWWKYDYLLGVSALESGKPDHAISALQRALAENPDITDAHLDLGRAYYKLNEFELAKAEFETVLETRPAKDVEDIAKNYLNLINNKTNASSESSEISFKYYLETAGGYDSNANYLFGNIIDGFEIVAENNETPSTYYLLKAGTQMYGRINKKNSFNVAASIVQRDNQNQKSVNSVNSYAQIAWHYRHKYAEQTIGGQVSKMNTAQDLENSVTAINFGLKFRLIIDAYLAMNGSMKSITYSESQSNQNAIQTMIGTSLSKNNFRPSIPDIGISLFAGESIPRASGATIGSKIKGGRVNIKFQWRGKLPVFLNIMSGILYSNYEKDQSSIKRSDTLMNTTATITIQPWKLWETSFITSLNKSQSNVVLYDYSRVITSISVKRYL